MVISTDLYNHRAQVSAPKELSAALLCFPSPSSLVAPQRLLLHSEHNSGAYFGFLVQLFYSCILMLASRYLIGRTRIGGTAKRTSRSCDRSILRDFRECDVRQMVQGCGAWIEKAIWH